MVRREEQVDPARWIEGHRHAAMGVDFPDVGTRSMAPKILPGSAIVAAIHRTRDDAHLLWRFDR